MPELNNTPQTMDSTQTAQTAQTAQPPQPAQPAQSTQVTQPSTSPAGNPAAQVSNTPLATLPMQTQTGSLGANPAPKPSTAGTTPAGGQQQTTQQQAVQRGIVGKLAHMAESAAKFHAIKNVLGSVYGTTTKPVMQPDGTIKEVPVKVGPGAIFKNILAAALLGGMAGEEAHNQNPFSGFAGGFVAGAGAEIKDERQRYLQAQKEATDNFARQQAVKEQNQKMELARKEDARAEQLNQANILKFNTQTIEAAAHTAEDSFLLQQAYGDVGQARINDIIESGGTYAITPDNETLHNVPYTKIMAVGKKYPQLAGKLIVEQTGVAPGHIDPKTGLPTTIPLYSAVTHPDKVTVSAETISQWEKDGLDPNILKNLKPGKELNWDQYRTLYSLAKSKYVENLKTKTAEAKLEEEKAAIKAQNVRASEYISRTVADELTARKAQLEISKAKEDNEELDQLKDAEKAWDKAIAAHRGDRVAAFSDLNSDQQELLLPSIEATQQKLTAEYKALPKDPEGIPVDQETGKQLTDALNATNQMISSYLGTSSAAVNKAVDYLKNLPKDKQLAYLTDPAFVNASTPAQREEIYKRLGLTPPPPQAQNQNVPAPANTTKQGAPTPAEAIGRSSFIPGM